MARSRPVYLITLLSLAILALAVHSRGGDDELARVGGTLDLVPDAGPVRWTNDGTVVFQSWRAVTTVRLDGEVMESRPEDPASPSTFGVRRFELEPLARFGQWQAWDGGWYLVSDDEKCGPPLVPSPDGRFVACRHVITNRLHETSESHGAVIRVR